MPSTSYNEQSRIAAQLEAIQGRFEELSIRITLPEVIADTATFTSLMRQHSELSELNDVAVGYRKLLDDIEGAREMLDDPDMAEKFRKLTASGSPANTRALSFIPMLGGTPKPVWLAKSFASSCSVRSG